MNRRSFFSFLAVAPVAPVAGLAAKPAQATGPLRYQIPNLSIDDELLMAKIYRVRETREIPKHWRLNEKKILRVCRGEEVSVYLHDVWSVGPIG